MMRLTLWRSVLAFALACATTAHAQYPAKPIRLVVPLPAGGTVDTAARLIAQPMSAALGQPIIVENRVGADGAIAASLVAKSAPDGYTILLASNGQIVAVPQLRANPPYDPLKDFTAIALLNRYNFFVFAHGGLPVNSIAELVAHARANPGKLEYGTGTASGTVAAAAFKSMTGIDMVQIPYKGDVAALADLAQGRIKVLFSTPVGVTGFIKDGRIKGLAALLPQRSSLLPEVPTMSEAGLPKFTISSWGGLFGPAGMPQDIVERLSREANAALKRPEVIEGLNRQNVIAQGAGSVEFTAFVKEQYAAWGQAIRDAGIKPD
jgi:tripartite-type tricarboxylate transporter receptor subunit TctC